MKKRVSVVVMVLGILLLSVGLFLKVPGTELTTYSTLDGTENYSSIEKYVGGDAYNFIIGASIVGSKISGTIAMKAIFIAVGTLIFSMGLVLFSFKSEADDFPVLSSKNIEDIILAEAVEESDLNISSEKKE